MNELREKLQQKRKSSKGFTLMEMLIVVAIIAILVAIAIPTFNSSLEKTRQAADQANARALKSVCVTEYMLDNTTGTFALEASSGKALKLKDDGTALDTGVSGTPYEPQSKKYKDGLGSGTKYITCTISVATADSGDTKKGDMLVTMNPSDVLG